MVFLDIKSQGMHINKQQLEKIFFKNESSTDLVFFSKNKKIHHVGILLNKNQIIHASGRVRIDEFTEKGIIHSKTKELTHRFHSIKRIIK